MRGDASSSRPVPGQGEKRADWEVKSVEAERGPRESRPSEFWEARSAFDNLRQYTNPGLFPRIPGAFCESARVSPMRTASMDRLVAACHWQGMDSCRNIPCPPSGER
jgi:hypothetical protein